MNDIFQIMGAWLAILCGGFGLAIATYGLMHFVGWLAFKKLKSTYQWVSVLYYMGICLRHGRKGMLKEVERSKSENSTGDGNFHDSVDFEAQKILSDNSWDLYIDSDTKATKTTGVDQMRNKIE